MNSCGMAKKNGIRREKETIQSLLTTTPTSNHARRFHEGLINNLNAAHIESHLYVPFTTFHSDDEFSLSFSTWMRLLTT